MYIAYSNVVVVTVVVVTVVVTVTGQWTVDSLSQSQEASLVLDYT